MSTGSITQLAGGLEPDPDTAADWFDVAAGFATKFLAGLEDAPAIGPALPGEFATQLSKLPAEAPGMLHDLLATFGEAAAHAVETAGPRHFAYVPGGGLVASALAEFLARVTNRYTALADAAPGLVAMEHSVLRWLCSEFGLPTGSGGVLTTGASTATLSAVVAARHERLGPHFGHGTIYVTEDTHRCVAKAAAIAGIPAANLRTVPTTPNLRMDPVAAAELIAADRKLGCRPFLLVGTAGTTSTGTVDPLTSLAVLARQEDLWLHVDAAYGGFFQLTRRGQARLSGISMADSITLDPHKSLFLPHGTGALLVRDVGALRAAHAVDGDYLQDMGGGTDALPDFAEYGVELTREFRGLRVWLPLHLHGVAAFRAALDEKLDLAEHLYDELSTVSGLHLPWRPDLSTVAFRDIAGNTATQRLLDRILAAGRLFMSSTRVRGQHVLRLCVLSHRSHLEHVDEALAVIRQAADELATARSAVSWFPVAG